MTLKDKRIIVLGGTSGIGLAVAEAAATDGAQVLVASSDDAGVKRALTMLPASAEGLVLDLSNATAIGVEQFRINNRKFVLNGAPAWPVIFVGDAACDLRRQPGSPDPIRHHNRTVACLMSDHHALKARMHAAMSEVPVLWRTYDRQTQP